MNRPVALALLALACAPHRPMAWQLALAEGNRNYTAGRMREAAAAFDRAARSTPRVRDRDEARYLAAQSLWRAGDLPNALSRMDALRRDEDTGRAARAALDAARIRLESGARDDAMRDLDALVRARPETGPARRALSLLLMELDRDDPTGAASHARLESWATEIPRESMLDGVLYEIALRHEREGHVETSIASWRRLLDALPYPQNRHWDDGALHLAQALQAQGDARGAIAVLDRALAVREPAHTSGSYEAAHFGECAMLRAALLRSPLGELDASARAYHFVYTSFPVSRLRDDALTEEAAVRAQMGDRAAACEVWVRIATEFPCTRRGRAAREQAIACGERVPSSLAQACHGASGAPRPFPDSR